MSARDVAFVFGLLLIVATLFGGIAGLADPHLKTRADKAKIVICFAVAFIGFIVLLANYSREQRSAAQQSRQRKDDRKFQDAVTHSSQRIEERQDETRQDISAIRRMLESSELENREVLARKYPYGYVVFGGAAGGFTHLPFNNHYVDGERINLRVAWSRIQFGEHPGWQSEEGEVPYRTLLLPDVSWEVESDDGNRRHGEEEHTSLTGLKLVKGNALRFLDCPGDINRYIEVLDPSPDHPSFVMGFRKQKEQDEGMEVPQTTFVDVPSEMHMHFPRLDVTPDFLPQNVMDELEQRYPFGIMVFTEKDGAFARIKEPTEYIDHLALVVGGDFKNASLVVSDDGELASFLIQEIHWATINDDGDIVGEQRSTFLTFVGKKSTVVPWARPKNRPGQINCYGELYWTPKPVLVLGYRIQPLDEKQPEGVGVANAETLEGFVRLLEEKANASSAEAASNEEDAGQVK